MKLLKNLHFGDIIMIGQDKCKEAHTCNIISYIQGYDLLTSYIYMQKFFWNKIYDVSILYTS